MEAENGIDSLSWSSNTNSLDVPGTFLTETLSLQVRSESAKTTKDNGPYYYKDTSKVVPNRPRTSSSTHNGCIQNFVFTGLYHRQEAARVASIVYILGSSFACFAQPARRV